MKSNETATKTHIDNTLITFSRYITIVLGGNQTMMCRANYKINALLYHTYIILTSNNTVTLSHNFV